MGKTLIVFSSRTGRTKDMAGLIAEGIRMGGHEAEIKNVTEIKDVGALAGYDAYVFGSPTYHGDMTQSVKTLLFLAEKAGLDGKPGGAFGAFGWSGEAPERIHQTMKNIFKMKMTGGHLRLKDTLLENGAQMAQGYGREVAQLMS